MKNISPLTKELNEDRQSDFYQVRLFRPDRMHFESLVKVEKPRQLYNSSLEKFPMQDPWLHHHPSLEHDYILRKSYKGALFMLSHSHRGEHDYCRLMEKRAVEKDLEFRANHTREIKQESLEYYFEQIDLKKDIPKTLRYAEHAESAEKNSRRFFENLEEVFEKREQIFGIKEFLNKYHLHKKMFPLDFKNIREHELASVEILNQTLKTADILQSVRKQQNPIALKTKTSFVYEVGNVEAARKLKSSEIK